MWFVTADASDPNQAFYGKVKGYEEALDRHLRAYRRARRGKLNWQSFSGRYQRNPTLLPTIAAITHSVARVAHLSDPRIEGVTRSEFAQLLFSQAELELCLVVEDLLRRRATAPAKTLAEMLKSYPKGHGVRISSLDIEQMSKAFQLTTSDASMGTLLATGSFPGSSRILSPREMDLAVVYAVRNKAAHGLLRPAGLMSDFSQIVERTMFAIFAAFEGLYR